MAELSYAEISKLLKYDAEAGKLYWLPRAADMFTDAKSVTARAIIWNARYANKEAFTANSNGYRQGIVSRKHFLAHQIAWLLSTGYWAQHEIDHINGNRSDNRIENLRDVPHAENSKNMRLNSRNKSGSAGVHWSEKDQRWCVFIGGNSGEKKKEYIGSFLTKEDALAARKDAEEARSYHENHGRYRNDPSNPAPPDAYPNAERNGF